MCAVSGQREPARLSVLDRSQDYGIAAGSNTPQGEAALPEGAAAAAVCLPDGYWYNPGLRCARGAATISDYGPLWAINSAPVYSIIETMSEDLSS